MASDILIQEPSDLAVGDITDATAADIAVVVYSKIPNQGGIMQLGLLPWKRYLDYDHNRVFRLEQCIGINVDLDADPFIPLTPSIQTQVDALFSQSGITDRNPSQPPEKTMNGRLIDAEESISVHSLQISELQDAVGAGSSGEGTLTEKVLDLETNNAIQDQDIANLKTAVGNNDSGLLHDVSGLTTTVYGPSDHPEQGLNSKVNALTTDVSSLKNYQLIIPEIDPEGGASLVSSTEEPFIYKVIARKTVTTTTTWFEGIFDRSTSTPTLSVINGATVNLQDWFDSTNFISAQGVNFISLQRIN